MPRISDVYTDIAIYVYKNRDDAEAGKRQGGSGFLIGVPFADQKRMHPYVVTNWHVVLNAETPVLRANRKDGGVEYFGTNMNDWVQHPNGDDVAILPLLADFSPLKYNVVPVGNFVTQRLIEEEDIGIGDDTFMVGRFINHEGIQQNLPAVRFGNIAMMPLEGIMSPSGLKQESFLVEVRSLPGYSGSAVFIYSPCAVNDMSIRRYGREKGAVKPPKWGYSSRESEERFWDSLKMSFSPKGPYLLGIDWCHLSNNNRVQSADGKEHEGMYTLENTGMAGVIPAWKIAELLEEESLKRMREQSEDRFCKEQLSLDS